MVFQFQFFLFFFPALLPFFLSLPFVLLYLRLLPLGAVRVSGGQLGGGGICLGLGSLRGGRLLRPLAAWLLGDKNK